MLTIVDLPNQEKLNEIVEQYFNRGELLYLVADVDFCISRDRYAFVYY